MLGSGQGLLPLLPNAASSFPSTPIGVKLDGVTDGTSNTLLVFEASWKGLDAASYRAWQRGIVWNSDGTCSKNVASGMQVQAYTTSGTYNDVSMGSNHQGGCNVVMGDGSVRFVRDSIPIATWRAMGTRSGGEVFQDN